ncbi:MAG: hypothetical protein ACD_33C00002G0029 [uncultured bacterium]|nr:MAG: hypothetical protein ACD_33C00002G0029 [uncultured bacterium]
MFKIIVDTVEEKNELLVASKYLHDLKNISSELGMVNLLMHLYTCPELIEVVQNG